MDNYVKSLPPIFDFARWDDMFMIFRALFIVSLGFVHVHAREMRNRRPSVWIFSPMLNLCVCVCVGECVCVFSLVPSLCFIFNLGLHCKQIHRPDGGPAG